MRQDFENLTNGQKVTLFPNQDNPLHNKPTSCIFHDGYFYCDESNPADGPDYYFGDVLVFNDGFDLMDD